MDHTQSTTLEEMESRPKGRKPFYRKLGAFAELTDRHGITHGYIWQRSGNRIYGCDDCLAVCPWNKFAEAAATNRAFAPRAELTAPELADLMALDDTDFRQVFSASPIKRIGRDRMIRNCLIAAGNSGSAALVGQVAGLLDDPSPEVRGAAIWALGRLDAVRWSAERERRAGAEREETVREEWAT